MSVNVQCESPCVCVCVLALRVLSVDSESASGTQTVGEFCPEGLPGNAPKGPRRPCAALPGAVFAAVCNSVCRWAVWGALCTASLRKAPFQRHNEAQNEARRFAGEPHVEKCTWRMWSGPQLAQLERAESCTVLLLSDSLVLHFPFLAYRIIQV